MAADTPRRTAAALLNGSPGADLRSIYECTHAETRPTRRRVAGGAVQIVQQCQNCGRAVGGAMARSSVACAGNLPDFDNALLERAGELRRAQSLAHQQARAEADAQWWSAYNAYLASPEWAAIRAEVLKRDKYLCQGCMRARAVEVHHRTYEHLENELLYELVSLCQACHDRVHPHRAHDDA